MYPSFYVSKREFALILMAMFFTFGVQNFERDPEGLGQFLGSDELPITRSGVAKWWLKYRTPVFLCCANVCIALIAIPRILRIWHAGLIR